MKKVILLLIALLGVVTTYCESIDSTINIQNIIVTTSKMNVNRNNVPMSITVIDRGAIESSSESALLPVLTQRVPGLFVTQKGITGFGVSSGAAGTINVRGVGQGNKVLVMFDGQPQWAGIFGHSLPDTYVASDVDRVEVIRGPGSLLYGSNAMGGVVNIITRHHDENGRRTQARVMYGSHNTQKYMINNGYKHDKFSSFISVNHDRTDGHRINSKFNITNGFAKVGYELNENYKVEADLSLAKYRSENPGMIFAPMEDNVMNVLRGTASLSVENKHEKRNGAFRAFYNWGNHKINNGYIFGGLPLDYLFRSTDHNYGAMLYQSFKLVKDNEFTVGIDYKNWGGEAWNDFFAKPKEVIVNKNVDEVAGYIIAQQKVWDFLTLNAGVRYEYNSVFKGVVVPQAGVILRAFGGNSIKASLSKGFRSPNIKEMYMYPSQNKDLKPENMLNYEISIGQSFMDGSLYIEATAFYIEGKDMILTVKTNEGPKNLNTGEFTNKGFEFTVDYSPFKGLNFNANYSNLHTSKPLLAAPKHKIFAMGSYNIKHFSVSVNTQMISHLYIDTKRLDTENYILLNAKTSYHFGSESQGVNVFLKGENLTDRAYTINYGYPMPGAIFMLGFDLLF